ncbi:MAG: alpha-amylase [Lachnospiraceae bacterium]|nr:alpha-amylase [Lachnospiraceae bacterium]
MTGLLVAAALLLSACGDKEMSGPQPAAPETSAATETEETVKAEETTANKNKGEINSSQMAELTSTLQPDIPEDKYRTTYEVFVYSFCDSDGDGVGDLQGLTSRLDYINDGAPGQGEDLECNGIWLMPIFPSPTYHKYDTTDYMGIDEEYGTMEDFENFLEEAHKRGITVILDLAVNHTSNEHPWFQEAATYLKSLPEGTQPDPGVCPYVEYYNFSREKRTGDEPLGGSGWYYEARFWSGMPDLNLDNENVRNEIAAICKFWLDKGVDGFRLDAVTSYYTEDTRASIDFLTFMDETVTGLDPDAYMVGEAWLNQNGYSEYYESGIDSFFDFKFAGAEGVIATAVNKGNKAPDYVEALEKEEALYASIFPDYINAPFYTNHDMARSFGYFAKGGAQKTKMAGALNLLMTGNAFLYYGEEIGMKGSGKDENKRAPMVWDSENKAEGTCSGPADMESFDQPNPGVVQQLEDPDSILNFYRSAIRIRNSFPVIARGATEAVELLAVTDETKEDQASKGSAAAFIRRSKAYEDVLVVFNVAEESRILTLPEEAASYGKLAAVLLADEGVVTRDGGTVTLPGYSVAVFIQ